MENWFDLEKTIKIFNVMFDEVLSYRNHYSNLGELVFQIDAYESFGDLIKDIENDNLQELGYFGADEYLLDEFLKHVLQN